jgi:DMSO/TMAO reductase YedYZ molybdopterin-dependent catalytic subunit
VRHRTRLARAQPDGPLTSERLPPARMRDAAGAVSGIASGTVALAVAQVGGTLVAGTRPPLQILGDFVIRTTPVSVTEALIRQVGRSDKLVLLICILVVATLAAACVGLQFVRGRSLAALIGIGLLAVLPVLATRGESGTSWLRELLVLTPAGGLGAAVLSALGRPLLAARTAERSIRGPSATSTSKGSASRQARRARQAAAEHAALVKASRGVGRRQLLRATLVLTAAAASGTVLVRQLSRPSAALMSRLRAALPVPQNELAALTDEFAVFGASPLVTPTSAFYRIDTALTPPQVDPDSWLLTLSRDGTKLATYTYEQLLDRATSQADITIGCVSNEVGGDLVGTARWQGVLLADLLREAGVTSAGRVAGVSVDGFVASFRGGLAFDGRPALVAVGMNSAPLAIKHGFPARLVVPGLYGYTSATKWLQRIDVSDSTDLPGFWADRGWAPDVTVHVMSRIDAPHNNATVPVTATKLAGIAWAPLAGIGAVELQVDGGVWQPARLSKPIAGTLWRQWVMDWQPSSGTHTIRVRATDSTGRMQDTKQRPVYPSGSTGLHQISVTVA